MSRGYTEEIDDESNVLVSFESIETETDRALLIRTEDEESHWLPKSQIMSLDHQKNEVWIPMWLAEKKGLDYR